jgi:hypothetical protein
MPDRISAAPHGFVRNLRDLVGVSSRQAAHVMKLPPHRQPWRSVATGLSGPRFRRASPCRRGGCGEPSEWAVEVDDSLNAEVVEQVPKARFVGTPHHGGGMRGMRGRARGRD